MNAAVQRALLNTNRSDPTSSNYGKLWSEEDVNRAFAPSEDTSRAVADWLIGSGIEKSRISLSDNQGWIGFEATTAEAEELFLAEFHEHEHSETGRMAIGCDE